MIQFFLFLGGISLFLYGMQIMGDALQQAAGARLQRILEKLTSKTIYGVALGAGVTAVLQSSGATTVMTVGLVNTGIMNLEQAFGIVMGANIGTTMTAQLIAFNLTDYITLILAIGFLMKTIAHKRSLQNLGMVLLGFGILMLGMSMMSNAAVPLRNDPRVVELLSKFSDHPLLGMLTGLCMTIIIQSSSATIGILMAMAGQGLIPLEGAVAVILGDNIGSCITVVIATIQSGLNAKRVAMSHVMFNLIGSIIALTLMHQYIAMVRAISPAGNIGRQIANAHTLFNVVNTCLFLPFAGHFTQLIKKIMPGEEPVISYQPQFLDKNVLNTPAVALGLAIKEVVRMGNLALDNVKKAFRCVDIFDKKNVEYILEHEPVIDSLEEAITVYLTKMSEQNMTKEMSALHTGLLHACTDIERIGDHAETIAKRVRSMNQDGAVFSEEANKEMRSLEILVVTAASKALKALETGDKELARESLDFSHQVKVKQKAIRKSHVERLSKGICTPESGFVMLELLINMKRVSDHSKNISQLVLGDF